MSQKCHSRTLAAIVATEPSKFAVQLHNRMPLVLEPNTWDLWLNGESDAAAALMKPAKEDDRAARPWGM